jgi:protein-S-isoprenylcysteine O-methyltransferase Ste14
MSSEEHAGVVVPPPLIFLTGLAVGFGLEALLPSADVPAAVRWPVGGALIVAGLLLLRTFVGAFRRAGTAVEPWRPSTAIVTSGPYRLTRNPAYLGMALAYAGIAIAAGALWPLATLLPTLLVIDRAVIAREERYLTRTFGDEYAAYTRTTRRWL